jgi:hypothetical protein
MFEIILWNNNFKTYVELERIAAVFADRLCIRLIQSQTNYYCVVRFAASALARAPLMMFCDDDVLPNSNYLSHFVSEFNRLKKEYGSNLAVCARGHRFRPHRLSEDCLDKVWEDSEKVEFFDEYAPETDVHFMHADNLIVPTAIAAKCLATQIPELEWALIDDYWMSCALSRDLGCILRKIVAGHTFTFTPSAEDQNIALFHNPMVRHERTRFYIRHMRDGWPFSEDSAAAEG